MANHQTVGTFVEFADESAQTQQPIATVQEQPMFMCTFTSDKGEEKWGPWSGENFFKMFGNNVSFAKHGQPLLNAATSINAGAKLFCRRIVAEDASLGNLAIIATVKTVPIQKTNEDGEKLYTDAEGNDTIEVTDTPVMINAASILYSAKTAAKTKTLDEAVTAIRADIGAAADTFLLYAFSDVGRGVSNKRIMIQPNYMLSKNMDYMMYDFSVKENGSTIENMNFVVGPTRVANNNDISLQSVVRTKSLQLKCNQSDTDIEAFVAKIQEITGITIGETAAIDILFGCDKKGVALPNLKVDPSGLNLQHPYGQVLANGDNGAFKNDPINAASYGEEMAKAWNGEDGNDIYNVDKFKVDCIIDANYPDVVKRAIETLVEFREDANYFRDMGLGLTSEELIMQAFKKCSKSMFCNSYHNSYDIIDPYSKKQIPVTIGYSLCKLLVPHLNNGRSRPFAGIKYDIIITDAVEGTVNFIPVICPGVNQKEILEDNRINYASYIDDVLVLETLYTSQEKLSGFSFINNILNVQQVVKVIRTKAPANRYTFLDGSDLETYKRDIEAIIDPFRSNFASISMEYMGDATYVSQKIYYAMLKVSFRDFVQTELFKVVAIANTNNVETQQT